MKQVFILFLLLIGSVQLSAQKNPFGNFDLKSDSTKEQKSSGLYGYGTFVGDNSYNFGEVVYADQFALIGRTLFGEKEPATLKLGMSYYYDFSSYYVKNNLFPIETSAITDIKRQKFATHSLGTDLFARLNFNKSNEGGMFLDLGFYGSINLVRKFKIKFESTGELAPYQEKSKVVYKKVGFLHRYNYGPVVRIGWPNFQFVVNYRLSDVFEENFEGLNLGEMPRIFVGFNVGS